MKKRETFIFYRSFSEALAECDDAIQLTMYRAIVAYALDDVQPQFTGIASILWKLIEPQLRANIKRWENGCKGGAPKGNLNAKKQPKNNLKTTEIQPKNNQETTEKQPNKNINKNININENKNINTNNSIVGKPTRTPFIKPTLESVERYVLDKSYAMDAREFYDYYESNGWMVGKNKMKSWTAAVANWARREKEIRPRRAQTVSMPNALVTQPDFYDD